jgi:hypothetical protein
MMLLDALRERGDNMLAHERAGKPPVLDFDYELISDARRFERSVNYALLRITRFADDCLEDCLDLAKPPVTIIDPRAGHGPGIDKVVFADFQKSAELPTGQTVAVELLPTQPGEFGFGCPMGMFRGRLIVE